MSKLSAYFTNKGDGLYILVAQRTAELAGEGFVFREVGKTTIRGHENSKLVYEVLAQK